MAITINCRPHLNGNTPADFEAAGRKLNDAVINLQQVLQEVSGACFHGRNYQHLIPLTASQMRTLDLATLSRLREGLDKIQALTQEDPKLRKTIEGLIQGIQL